MTALMDTDQGRELVAYATEKPSPSMATASTSGAPSPDAADVVDPLEYLHLAGMIGAIRSVPEDLEWIDRESNPGPQFRTGDIDVLKTLKQLDIHPVGHLLTISEAANDKLLQYCQKNQKCFTYQRIQWMLKKQEETEEVVSPEPDTKEPEAARIIAAISLAEKDHFIRAWPLLWKSAECDCEVWGTWQWIRCPIGICNVPATFQRAMNMVFQNFVRKTLLAQSIINYCVIVYMNDILVYSSSYEGHVPHIECALHALRNVCFKVALEKIQFFLTTISFLGHVVTDKGLQPESQKVAAVRDALLWRENFEELSFCLARVQVKWTGTTEYPTRIENPELLIIQGWRTNAEGDLIGFLFGSVRPGRRQLIAQELIAPIVQLADDLSPDIYFQSDNSPGPYIFERSLDPYLQWTLCLEEPRDEDTLLSRQKYLKPYEIPYAFYPRAKEVVINDDDEEEGDDEETSEEGNYSEHSKGELSEEEEEEKEARFEREAPPEEATCTGTEAEDQEAAQKREEIASGKRQLEFASEASLRLRNDPTQGPEPPKPEDGHPAAATSSTARRRWRRSPSSSSPTRPPVRPRTDAGDRRSSSDAVPPTP
ncbi:hypothetical protein CBR_g23590 [Chara braunii]|uniref:Reverse transcriptase domain-containing protein n=1 Tax=Chara braunii TaxID=69332 RepID=A0A388L4T9_CHABU|nr:hypothetical protein CBR_g23590 [Chara braunii]|eukprot:GBG77262.1 hypothetical protein CBR_g23590 [Chara braunii]